MVPFQMHETYFSYSSYKIKVLGNLYSENLFLFFIQYRVQATSDPDHIEVEYNFGYGKGMCAGKQGPSFVFS